MSQIIRSARKIWLITCVLILAGCSTPPAQSAPTADVQAIRTEAAQTVIANLTLVAQLNPPATATEAPAASATPLPALPTLAPQSPDTTDTPFVVNTQSTGGAGVVNTPTWTFVQVEPTKRKYSDAAKLTSQKFPDATVFKPGEDFNMVWNIKNVGVKTWTTEYFYQFSHGTNFSNKNDFVMLTDKVKPGESLAAFADMIAPINPGTYTTYWNITNDNKEIFFTWYFTLIVK